VYFQAKVVHAAVSDLFDLGRHLVRAEHCRNLGMSAFADGKRAVAWDQVADSCGLNVFSCQSLLKT